MANANEKERDEYTFGEIEQLLVNYLDKNGNNLEIGTPDFTEFVINQMHYDSDQKLAKLPEYHLFVAYFAEYLHQLSLFETEIMAEYNPSTISSDSSIADKTVLDYSGEKFSMSYLKDVTLGEIKEEILQEEREIAKLQESKQPNSEIMATINVAAARAYATKYYKNYNTAYPRYSNDCTNFVSQILHAGGRKQVTVATTSTLVRDTKYWFIRKRAGDGVWTRSSSWSLVEDLYSHLVRSHTVYTSSNKSNIVSQARPGDVIQFKKSGADRYTHAMWVNNKVAKSSSKIDLLLAGHTNDYLTRSLDDITGYSTYRIIKM
ncbi:amidase domain-containing protein [Paucisalibacillus globulus]|uniref:amidase domain-containing protein n=1 Tax=Paucisalibacillus globulus TaxID=351095 RepID=UPI001143EDA9|nr:amidase domain-containing protein [Paucisalibacillus globulus]